MNTEIASEKFNDDIDAEMRRKQLLFAEYVKSKLDLLEKDVFSRANIAYEIIGFWGSQHRYEIKDGSDIDEILTIAGELELDRTGMNPDWEVLMQKIRSLATPKDNNE